MFNWLAILLIIGILTASPTETAVADNPTTSEVAINNYGKAFQELPDDVVHTIIPKIPKTNDLWKSLFILTNDRKYLDGYRRLHEYKTSCGVTRLRLTLEFFHDHEFPEPEKCCDLLRETAWMFEKITFNGFDTIMAGDKCIPKGIKISNFFITMLNLIKIANPPTIIWHLFFNRRLADDITSFKELLATTQVSQIFYTPAIDGDENFKLLLQAFAEAKFDIKNMVFKRMTGADITTLVKYIPLSKLEYLTIELAPLPVFSDEYFGIPTALANVLPKTSTLKFLDIKNILVLKKKTAAILAAKVNENKSLETLLLGPIFYEKSLWDGVLNGKRLKLEHKPLPVWASVIYNI